VVGNDRVLITEYRGRQVTERNFKGEVIWQHAVNNFVLSAQRLENGNTLIVSRNDVTEVNKTGQAVFNYQPQGLLIVGARRLKNGDLMVLERNGVCQRINRKGEAVKRIAVPALTTLIGTQFDVLPNGNILLPLYLQQKVVEISQDGKEVWQHTCERPTAATRLPNGNTLIASRYSKMVIEVDRAGKKVWEFEAPNGNVIAARRR
jgi:outer membrane protein assembly factor BamB